MCRFGKDFNEFELGGTHSGVARHSILPRFTPCRQANSDQSTCLNITKDINRHETATCFDPYTGHLQVHNNSVTVTGEDNVYVKVLIKITENKDHHHHHHHHHIGATSWFQP